MSLSSGLQGMPIQMLNGGPFTITDLYQQADGSYTTLGCPCQDQPMNGAADYDVIVIGGKQYSANQILDKTIIASRDTKVYTNAKATKVFTTIKSGEPIGKVYSFLKPSNSSTDGRGWLMFEYGYNQYYYAPNESVPPPTNTPTLDEELRQEELEKLKESNPLEYYIQKYATKVLVTGVVVFVGITLGKEVLRHFLNKKSESKKPQPALAGVKRKNTKTKK